MKNSNIHNNFDVAFVRIVMEVGVGERRTNVTKGLERKGLVLLWIGNFVAFKIGLGCKYLV